MSNSRQKGIQVELMKLLMNKTKKKAIVFIFSKWRKRAGEEQKIDNGWFFLSFREKMSSFSLDFRPFEPSVLDGARSKVDLHGEGYAWTPIW